MIHARRWSLALLALFVLALPGCSSTGTGGGNPNPVVSRIQSSGVIRVGMTGNQPPFNMVNRSGETIGLEVDLANALAGSLGVRAEVVNKPFAELLPALESGDVDMVISGLTMTPERNLKTAFAGPYFISGKAILTKSETLAKAEAAAEINSADVSLAALESSTSQRFVEGAMPDAKLVTVPDYDTGVQKVISGEVDALVADFPICILSVLRNRDADLTTVVSPFTFDPIGIALPANDALLVNLVENYLATLEGTGLMEALREKWFLDGSWLSQLP